MSADPAAVAAQAGEALRAGTALRACPVDARARWLQRSAELLLDEDTGLCRELHERLPEETGLSPQMVHWGLRSSLRTVEQGTLERMFDEAGHAGAQVREPIALLAIVLAGNLFAAALRAMFVPLLFGVPVVAKASSRDSTFAEILCRALREVDPELGRAAQMLVFAGGDLSAEDALLQQAEAVSIYGSDDTIAAIGQRLGRRIPVIAHGHGVSVAFCGKASLSPPELDATIERLAIDVAAYDQRGCLSPQWIFVEPCESMSAEAFAELLSRFGLQPLSARLPRGPLPPAIGAAQAQWRGVAEAMGTLIVGTEHAVAVATEQAPRWSPGYRNVTIVPVRDADEAIERMRPFSRQLKCIGVTADALEELSRSLERHPSNAAFICEVGSMQTPPFDAATDGRPAWEGLLRSGRFP